MKIETLRFTSLLDTLPTEIISAILIHGLPEPAAKPIAYKRYVSTSCAVNRRFRTIAINTHPLWTRISIDDPDDLHLTAEMIEHSLKRSGVLPLDISVCIFRRARYLAHDRNLRLTVAKHLKSNYSRAKTISLEFGDNVCPIDFLPLSGSLWRLEDITLRIPIRYKSSLRFIKATDFAPMSLRILSSNPAFVRELNPEHLIRLHFDTMSDLDLSLLQKCHAVEWLRLDHGTGTCYLPAQLPLPRIKVKNIGGPMWSSYDSCIGAPLLEHLTVTTDSFDVSCDFPNLRTITTSNISVFDCLKQKQTIVAIRLCGLRVRGWSWLSEVAATFPNVRFLQIQIKKGATPHHLAQAIVGAARGQPKITFEILIPRLTPKARHRWASAYDELESLENVAILHSWGDLEDRYRVEDHRN